MKKLYSVLFLALCAVLPLAAQQEDSEFAKLMQSIPWEQGPCTSKIGNIAEIKVPAGFVFAGAKDTQKLMEAMQNEPHPNQLGLVMSKEQGWFILFEWDEIGYVKDNEEIDPDALYKAMLENEKVSNEGRAERGWNRMYLQRWFVKPSYNADTNNLEYGTAFKVENYPEETVNFCTKILGRRGVMLCTLVLDPGQSAAVAENRRLLADFAYVKGGRYDEFVAGDKVAEYGLAALVLGGGAALAAKVGILQKFWKLIVAGVIAVGAFAKKYFKKLTGRR